MLVIDQSISMLDFHLKYYDVDKLSFYLCKSIRKYLRNFIEMFINVSYYVIGT